MKRIFIDTEFITLGQFLKYIGVISNGSEAKYYVINNKIMVNNELETRRGRKIYPDFVVKIGKNEYLVCKNVN